MSEDTFKISDRRYWFSVTGVLLLIFSYQFVSGASSGLSPDSPWNGAALKTLPVWLQIWLLGAVTPSLLGSLLFVWKHPAARWVFAGTIVSHIPIVMQLWPLTVGLVGWIHLVSWMPGLIALVLIRPKLALFSAYGFWVNVATLVIFVSLIFDGISATRYSF